MSLHVTSILDDKITSLIEEIKISFDSSQSGLSIRTFLIVEMI